MIILYTSAVVNSWIFPGAFTLWLAHATDLGCICLINVCWLKRTVINCAGEKACRAMNQDDIASVILHWIYRLRDLFFLLSTACCLSVCPHDTLSVCLPDTFSVFVPDTFACSRTLSLSACLALAVLPDTICLPAWHSLCPPVWHSLCLPA